MYVIYHCHPDTPYAAVAAAIHLGRIQSEGSPDLREVAALPAFRGIEPGRIVFLGRDGSGNQVCALAIPGDPGVISRVLDGIAAILDPGGPGVKLVDASPQRWSTVSGGPGHLAVAFLSPVRRVRAHFSRLRGLVQAVKKELQPIEPPGRVTGPSGGAEPAEPSTSGGVFQLPLVFYHCYGSAHSSVVASAIHVGLLPQDRTPTPGEIAGLEHFDRLPHHLIGLPIHIGRDESGHEVYIVGLGGERRALKRAAGCLVTLMGFPRDTLMMFDALTAAGLFTRIGGFLSRRLGLVRLGRPLCIAELRRDYPRFVRVVREAKATLRAARLDSFRS